VTGGAGLPAADAATVEIGAYALPMRGINHAMVRSTGSPLQRNLCFSSAFTANALAWSGVCRRSRGSAIHSRMMVLRAPCSGFMFQVHFHMHQAALESGRMSRRRAEKAEPSSRTVEASTTRPCLSNAE